MMKLYSGSVDPFSHRCRIVLFEKGMDFEVIDVDLANKAEDLAGRARFDLVRSQHYQRIHR
jgi:stringent starvation protein A